MTAKQENRAAMWWYVLAGAIVVGLGVPFIGGMLHLGPLSEANPMAPFLAGGALGWIIWRLISRRKTTPPY